MSRLVTTIMGAVLGAATFAASAAAGPLVCTGSGPSELLGLDNRALMAELQTRLDRNATRAASHDVVYSTSPSYTHSSEAAAHCSIAVGYMRTRTRDEESINRCDCLDQLATYQPPANTCPSEASTTVYFDTARWAMTPADEAALTSIADEANRCGLDRAIVAGHTDRVGTDAANQSLSVRRADQVADFLEGRGLDRSRIDEQAYGESQLAVPTDDNVPERRNRRTEVHVRFVSDAGS
ncbi:MAG: OmpA family protein [Sphingomonadales bacterium]|nr:MAG: OmpA family protein [Sphingomonadales bacterium]